jgi:D-alanine transaminase
MTRIAYIDGAFMPQHEARVMMEDRGYQFADGVYEVTAFMRRKLLDSALHLDRLERSLAAIDLPMPMSRAALKLVLSELIRRNTRDEGLVYMQITRGVAARQHAMPANMKPVLSMSVLPIKMASDEMRMAGAKAMSAPDIRWARCDIKSIALLPNILARAESQDKGLRETFFVNEKGEMTEGTATNLFMVDADGTLHTHPKTHAILPGVTRDVVLHLAAKNGIKISEKPFTLKQAYAANELFFTSTSVMIMPVIALDGKVINDGKAGDIAQKLTALYAQHSQQEIA